MDRTHLLIWLMWLMKRKVWITLSLESKCQKDNWVSLEKRIERRDVMSRFNHNSCFPLDRANGNSPDSHRSKRGLRTLRSGQSREGQSQALSAQADSWIRRDITEDKERKSGTASKSNSMGDILCAQRVSLLWWFVQEDLELSCIRPTTTLHIWFLFLHSKRAL